MDESVRARIIRLHTAGSLTDAQLYSALDHGLVLPSDVVVAKPVSTANLEAIRALAVTARADNLAYVASTPTTAEASAQIKALSRQVNALIRLALSDFSATN